MPDSVHLTRSSSGYHPIGSATVRDRLRDFSTDRRLLLLSAMALVVGTASAAAAWALLRLINLATNLAYFGRIATSPAAIVDNTLGPWAAAVPVLGCLIIGLMARYGSEKIRGHGIPEAMEAILIGRSRIQPKVALLKPLSSAVSIGTGGPFGAEGPIIMTGGALGSLFAQLFHLSSAERKTLLVAGAAAGMAATFGTPVAAMLLAIELLLFEWKPRSFVPVAIAAVVAAAWRPWLMGGGVLFPMTHSTALPALGLPLAAGLGVLAGLMSGGLTLMVYACEDLFRRLPLHWMWWPMVGGAVIGLGGLVEPQALGVGYDNIASLLAGTMTGMAAVRLMVGKALIWSVALGSGTSGGILAPLLMMGGAAGALFAGIVPAGDSGTWALIGMAALMSATMGAPLTAIIFAVEVTHTLDAVVPLAIGCTMAHATTALLLRRSILTEKVARRGHHVLREYVIDPFEAMRVADIMATPVQSLPAALSLGEAAAFFSDPAAPPRHKCYPVVEEDGRVVGMAAHADVRLWLEAGQAAVRPLRDLLAGLPLAVGYEDEVVGQVADRMDAAGLGRIAILRRSDGALAGLVARRDLLRVRASATRQERERETLIRLPARRAMG